MNFAHKVAGILSDFLFPKNRRTLELEAISPSKLLEILPPAERAARADTLVLFDYDNPVVKDLVWELKYKGNRIVADKLGQILFDFLTEELSERALFQRCAHPRLIPLPISDKRRFERGWNQAELLTEAICRLDRKHLFRYLPRQLVKHVHTESQTQTAGRQERLNNLKNTMRVLRPEEIMGRCVVLIDDVTTTGATFREARRALLEAGVKKIFCVAVAH